MEKIILVNAVETSSQSNSSEIAESLSGGFLRSPKGLPHASELSKTNEYGKVVKIAITDGQQVLFCQVVLAKDKTTAITTSHLQNTIKALERLLKDQKTVKWRICKRSLWQVVQTFKRSLLIMPQDASLVLLLRNASAISRFCQQKNQGANQT